MKYLPSVEFTSTLSVVGLFLALWPAAVFAADENFAVEIALHENTFDGCSACGCALKDTLRSAESKRYWLTFGLVERAEDRDWKQRGPDAVSYCGEGDFRSLRKSFKQLKGSPFIVVQASISMEETSGTITVARSDWSIETFTGFGIWNRANYDRHTLEQVIDVHEATESALVVLNADDRTREQFRIDDLVASLKISLLDSDPVDYGSIRVTADSPGAWILLDGGFVGRIVEGAPFSIEPLPTGDYEVTVRDYSGREAKTAIHVLKNQSSQVELNLLPSEVADSKGDLANLGANANGFEEYWRIRDGALMVGIPAGSFLMGNEGANSEPDQQPFHRVYLDAFLIDKTEVTWRQFRKFSDATRNPLPPAPQWGRPDNLALSSTVWEEAEAYCAWVGGRLPTEAEWEKAARGEDGRTYPWGNTWDPTRCNSISGGLHQPEPVGSFPGCISPYGVLDMVGSHWQWVSDYYDADYYKNSPESNPRGPDYGSQKVKRGGYWMNHPQQLGVARRGHSSPNWRNSTHGFRCVMDTAEADK